MQNQLPILFHISVIFPKSKHWLTVHWADRPVSRAVVAVVGQKVIIQLPENVQRDATVGGRHVVVGLPEHGVEAVQGQELTEELVSEAVDVKKTFQFLSPSGTDWRTSRGEKEMNETLMNRLPALKGIRRRYHDWGEVFTLKSVDGQFQRLVKGSRNPLSDESVQIDGAA